MPTPNVCTLSNIRAASNTLLVLLESEWVLRSRYGFNREALLSIFFRALLEAREPSFEDEPASEEALFRTARYFASKTSAGSGLLNKYP
jgi:hypothetical protein